MYVWVRRNESSSLIMEQRAEFLSHGLVPMWVAKGISEVRRFGWERDYCSVVGRKGIVSVRGCTIRHQRDHSESMWGLGSGVLIDLLKRVIYRWRGGLSSRGVERIGLGRRTRSQTLLRDHYWWGREWGRRDNWKGNGAEDPHGWGGEWRRGGR